MRGPTQTRGLSELDPALLLSPLIGQSHAIRRLREQVKVAQQAHVRVMLIGPAILEKFDIHI